MRKFAEGLSKPDQEWVALLAIKHGMPSDKVETILDEYLSEHDFTYKNSKLTVAPDGSIAEPTLPSAQEYLRQTDKTAVAATLTRLAAKHAIDRPEIASIILEYIGLSSLRQAGEPK